MRHLWMLLAFLLVGCQPPLHRPPGVAAPPDGKIAIQARVPDFTLKDSQGQPRSLYQLFGKKGTLVIFFSTECPCSNAYQRRIERLRATYEPLGIRFVAVDQNDVVLVDKHAIQGQGKAGWQALGLLTLQDPRHEAARRFGAQVTPEVYLIDADGVLRYRGRIDDDQDESKVRHPDLASALAAFIAGRPIDYMDTAPAGCFIPY